MHQCENGSGLQDDGEGNDVMGMRNKRLLCIGGISETLYHNTQGNR